MIHTLFIFTYIYVYIHTVGSQVRKSSALYLFVCSYSGVHFLYPMMLSLNTVCCLKHLNVNYSYARVERDKMQRAREKN